MGKRSCSFEVALRAHTLGGHERQRSTASTTHDLVLFHSHYLAAHIASASVPFGTIPLRTCYRSYLMVGRGGSLDQGADLVGMAPQGPVSVGEDLGERRDRVLQHRIDVRVVAAVVVLASIDCVID